MAGIKRIKGKSKRDVLRGTKGVDYIAGLSGNDVLKGLDGNDRIFGDKGDDRLFGGKGNDKLFGRVGKDTLDGGAGKDLLAGGKDDDTYIINDAQDTIQEKAGQGIDTVQSSIDYVLGANLENLVLVGTQNLKATGNELANTITGNAGNNTLDGRGGADRLVGGLGDDLYIVDNLGDVVIEQANGGTDTVRTTVANYAKPINVEFIEFIGTGSFNVTGGSANNTITGGKSNDVLNGGGGNDTLNGGGGDDNMSGGAGNDTYIVDSVADVVKEAVNGGTDLVKSTVDYVLGDNVENLELLDGALKGTGNVLDNIITGTTGNNILDGGLGADKLIGGLGSDTYIVDNALDFVDETANGGTDLVKSTVDYVLGDNVENLDLLDGALKGTGNALDNIITGTTGNNILDGGLGADKLIGGLGNDTYLVDNALDLVDEAANGGTDLVKSTVDYVLGDNVENLDLLDGALKGTGNALDNIITGTAGNNILKGGNGVDTLIGGAGTDTLIGGAGVDTLIGGTGLDTFVLDTLDGDIINDFDAAQDLISLDKTAFSLTQLVGSALGVNDFVTVANDAAAQIFGGLAPIVYSAGSGKLFFNQDGVLPGFGNGGVIATVANATGTAPVLSAANLVVNSIV